MYEFEYSHATSLDDAASRLGGDEDARLVAGGMTLLPTLKLRLAKPSQLIDLAGLPELKGISEEGDAVVIGAMTRHGDVNRSDVVKRAIPALAAMAGMIGDPAVRNRGTIGGSIANNDPAADYPAAVVALNATCAPTSARSRPTISLPACSRPRSNRARSSPRCASRKSRSANYQKFRNPASRYAIVGVFVAKTGGRRAGRGDRRRPVRVPRSRKWKRRSPAISLRMRSRTSRSRPTG